MSFRVALIAAAGLVAAFSAQADPMLSPAWYVDMQVGKSSVSSKVYEESHNPIAGFALGRQFTPNIGVDVFARTMSFQLFADLFGQDDNYYPDLHWGAEVVARAPLGESFSVFGTAGAGRTRMHSDASAKGDYRVTDYTGGVGLGYEVSKQWTLQLTGTHFSHTGVNTVLFGAQYRW